MPSALLSRVKKLEQNPEVIKAAERRDRLQRWQWLLEDYDPYLKRFVAIEQYMGSTLSPGIIADDFLEFEITVTLRLLEIHPIEVGESWSWVVAKPVRQEVHGELIMRWYGIKRTSEEQAEIDRLCDQLVKDFDAGLPREQSEAAAYFKQWYEKHPRRNYKYVELPQFKPEGWEWLL